MNDESIEAQIARIDENVKLLLKSLPMVRRHDKELFAAKVVLGIMAPLLAIIPFWIAHKLGVQIF